MREKVCRRVEIWVYVLCLNGNSIDLLFQYEEKPHLRAKMIMYQLDATCAFR